MILLITIGTLGAVGITTAIMSSATTAHADGQWGGSCGDRSLFWLFTWTTCKYKSGPGQDMRT